MWWSFVASVQVKRRVRQSTMASRQAAAMTEQSKHASTATAKPSILQTEAEQRNLLLDEYFEKTKLLQVIHDFMANLATTYKTQLRLPANPYPELLKIFRMHELRQAFILQSGSNNSSSMTLTVLAGQTSTPSQFQVCSVEHEQFALPIWGTKSTLEQLTGANLRGLLELLNSAFQGLAIYKEFIDDDCRATAYGVLVGNNIFGAEVQDLQPCFMEIETHVFVCGVHLEKTMTVFARFLIKQLHEASNAAAVFALLPPGEAGGYTGCIACDGIAITRLDSSSAVEMSPHDAESAVWTIDRVQENRAAFITAVKTALVSNSLISLNRFDSATLTNFDGGCLCQTKQTFFFHVAGGGGKSVNSKSTTSPRSFLAGSLALATGVYFQSQGALEIAARFRSTLADLEEQKRMKQSKTKQIEDPTNLAASGSRSRLGFVGLFQDTIDELRRIGLANEVFRQQISCLVSCFAYNLGHLVNAHQVLEGVIYRSKYSATMSVMVQERFVGLESRMMRYLDELDLFPPTSVMYPVGSLIRHFYRQVKAAFILKDERQTSEFVEALRCVNELLLLVIRAVFSDFIRLVRTTVALPVVPALANPPVEINLDEIDVLRALEAVVKERKYPPPIVSEAIFAQAIIDSCLDVALESAVMNTVANRLPPNPFIDISNNLKVFALRQLVWSQELKQTSSLNTIKIAELGSLEFFSMEGINICAANPRLLQAIGANGDKIVQAHRWLMEHHIFHESASKNSYLMTVVPMMLIFHPVLVAKTTTNEFTHSLVEEIDTIEHYVILEGKDYAQEGLLFVDVVHSDLQRITSVCTKDNEYWQLRAKAQVFNSHEEVVIELDLSPLAKDDVIAEIIQHAMDAQNRLQVAIQIMEVQRQGDSSSLSIHKVTKAYVFHHHSAGSSTRLSPLLLFRTSEYGVFFSKEEALLCLKNMEVDIRHPQVFEIPRKEWTPYASEALDWEDCFLLYEIGIVHNTPYLRRNRELTDRLIMHSDVCQLYSLEQAIRWLLDTLQTRLQQLTPSKCRKEDSLTPATVFSILHRFALQIITQMEQLVVPLNHQLNFLHKISGPLVTLRNCVARWQTIQPPTEEQLEFQHKQQDKQLVILPTPRDDPVAITSELVDSLRTSRMLVLFVRFSYQRAFFVNVETDKQNVSVS